MHITELRFKMLTMYTVILIFQLNLLRLKLRQVNKDCWSVVIFFLFFHSYILSNIFCLTFKNIPGLMTKYLVLRFKLFMC